MIRTLLERLRAREIGIFAAGEQIELFGNIVSLTMDDAENLRQDKAAVLDHLRHEQIYLACDGNPFVSPMETQSLPRCPRYDNDCGCGECSLERAVAAREKWPVRGAKS